jgi:hypothetical protein
MLLQPTNKPLALLCAAVAAAGLLILTTAGYHAIVYGHGNLEAGNFHRCVYSAERDPVTGSVHRDWDTRWDLVSGTESSMLAQGLDMWFLGIGLLVAGAGIYAADQAFPRVPVRP